MKNKAKKEIKFWKKLSKFDKKIGTDFSGEVKRAERRYIKHRRYNNKKID